MIALSLSRFALSITVGASLLAGCGGSQLPMAPAGALPQPSATGTGPENITIYKHATRKAQEYQDPGPFYNFSDCVYDGGGNLFVSGYTGELGELPKGAGAFINYKP